MGGELLQRVTAIVRNDVCTGTGPSEASVHVQRPGALETIRLGGFSASLEGIVSTEFGGSGGEYRRKQVRSLVGPRGVVVEDS